jgi:hypothetical protein
MTETVSIGAYESQFDIFAYVERQVCKSTEFSSAKGGTFIVPIFTLNSPIVTIFCLSNQVYPLIGLREV